MATKRTSDKSSSDEQTNEYSDSVFQQDDNAKRAKLASLSNTTLRDLPIELLELILIKTVTMEVMDAKLVKNVWKEKADHVINRLITVSPLWSSILTTNVFRNKVNRILDDTAQKPIRLEILKQSSLEIIALDMTTMKDGIFVLWRNYYHGYSINVYDFNNLVAVKDVIRLSVRDPLNLTGCSVSNCVYLLDRTKWFEVTVLRITKGGNNHFKVSELISYPYWLPTLSVTTTGGFILSRHLDSGTLTVISTFNADGALQHEMCLRLEISSLTHIIQKSNGNLVLVSEQCVLKVAEIDPKDGTVLRQYLFSDSLRSVRTVIRTDFYGRILMIAYQSNRLLLLDSDFNLLELVSPQLSECRTVSPQIWHYNSERNEIVCFLDARNERVSFVDTGYGTVRLVSNTIDLLRRGALTILGFKDK